MKNQLNLPDGQAGIKNCKLKMIVVRAFFIFNFAFFIFNLSLSAQKRPVQDDVYFQPEKKPESVFIPLQPGNQQTEFEWMRFNLAQYHRQRQITFALGVASVALTCAGLATEDKNVQTGLLIAGGAISLGGLYSYFRAEKFLKRASSAPPL